MALAQEKRKDNWLEQVRDEEMPWERLLEKGGFQQRERGKCLRKENCPRGETV